MPISLNNQTGELTGDGVVTTIRRMGDMQGVYADQSAWMALDPKLPVYRIQAYEPCPEGTPGAICCATTFLEPGLVGDEYFLTRGHFHANQDCPEMEVVISGSGLLVLMTEDSMTRTETMSAGSVHHVPPGTAHRVVNTGDETLVFVSYWASETGHDYATIRSHGFGVRVKCVGGEALVESLV